MGQSNDKIAVSFTSSSLAKTAKLLATRLDLPLLDHKQNSKNFPFLLIVTPKRLELRETSTKNAKPIFVDFLSPRLRYRTQKTNKNRELIAKAIGMKNKKNPFVIDATAGFGVDAFILSSLGAKVIMLERSLIIGALLQDGLERLQKSPSLKSLKISLKLTQAYKYLNEISQNKLEKPDVIYLDPMYPERTKSALNKKAMRILHELVGSDKDAPKLLKIALKCAKNRVVVKRPRHADHLGNLKPDLELSSGRSSRYDIYLTKNRKKE